MAALGRGGIWSTQPFRRHLLKMSHFLSDHSAGARGFEPNPLRISLPRGVEPFDLTRKAERYHSLPRHQPKRAIDAVEPAGEAEMVCIAVDAPDGLFVIDGFVVTHNTVVAEYAIWQARRAAQRAIYTAPLKALSNQKFRDLRARYGAGDVGLLTGGIVENPRAPIVVMTTQIYPTMLLESARAAQVTLREEAAELVRPVRERCHRKGARPANDTQEPE